MSNLTALHTNTPVQNGAGFALQPANMQEAMQVATMVAGSQLAPKDFRGKPEDTLVAMMMGSELGLNPMQAIQNIAVINGRPSIWGDALLALVQNHPAFKSIEETFDDSNMTAKCVVTRKGGIPHTTTFSQDDATTAGLWGRNTWKQYPKRMLAMRARGFALRNQFADALLGLITTEEAQDTPEDNSISYTEESKTTTIEPKPELQFWPDDKFQKKIDIGLLELIASGQRTADQIINTLLTKGQLTEQQINTLRGAENESA